MLTVASVRKKRTNWSLEETQEDVYWRATLPVFPLKLLPEASTQWSNVERKCRSAQENTKPDRLCVRAAHTQLHCLAVAPLRAPPPPQAGCSFCCATCHTFLEALRVAPSSGRLPSASFQKCLVQKHREKIWYCSAFSFRSVLQIEDMNASFFLCHLFVLILFWVSIVLYWLN